MTSPPASWPRAASLDYGEAAPKATLYWAFSPDYSFAVIYDEYYERGQPISAQVAHARVALGPHFSAKTTRFVLDKAAPLLEYAEQGMVCEPSMNLPGQKHALIATANRLLATGRVKILRGRCPNFVREAARLVHKPSPTKLFTDERDRPVARDDHACDAFAYGAGAFAPLLVGTPRERPPAPPEWPPPDIIPARARKAREPSLESYVDGLLGIRSAGIRGLLP